MKVSDGNAGFIKYGYVSGENGAVKVYKAIIWQSGK